MKILVCMKQVPQKDAPLKLNEAGTWIREDVSYEVNEPDAYALEEALRQKEKHGGEVVAITAGPAMRSPGRRLARTYSGASRHAPPANTRLAFSDASALSRGANAGVISSALAAAPIASTATASITSGLSGMRKPYWLR